MLSMAGLHRDPKYFADLDKFDPERFNAERKHEINAYAYYNLELDRGNA